MEKYTEKKKRYMKEYYERNKEVRNAYSKKYHVINKKRANSLDKERYRINPAKRKDQVRGSRLKKYGIDEMIYEQMLSLQNGACLICLQKERGNRKLSVDHCHATQRVRGLLCRACNLALGHLKDNPYLCQRASQYLLNNIETQ